MHRTFEVEETLLEPGGYRRMLVPYRLATAEEIRAAIALPGAPHVTFGCTSCGMASWSAKNLALSVSGGYTGARNIFFRGTRAECSCPSSALRMIVDDGRKPARPA